MTCSSNPGLGCFSLLPHFIYDLLPRKALSFGNNEADFETKGASLRNHRAFLVKNFICWSAGTECWSVIGCWGKLNVAGDHENLDMMFLQRRFHFESMERNLFKLFLNK